MTPRSTSRSAGIAAASFALSSLLLLTTPASAVVAPDLGTPAIKGGLEVSGNIDVRVNSPASFEKVLTENASAVAAARRAVRPQAMLQGLAELKAAAPGAEVEFSALVGAAEVVRGNKPLSGPDPRPGFDIVRDFVRAHGKLYGLTDADVNALHFIGESVSKNSGLRMVRVEQMVAGVPVFQSETRFLLDRDGRIVRSVGLMVPGASATPPSLAGLIGADEAFAAAMESVGIKLQAGAVRVASTAPSGLEAQVASTDARISGSVPSRIVYFAIAPGVLVPAWSQVAFTTGDQDWYTIVDATSGTVLWRKGMREYASTQQARFSVYVQADGVTPADSPAPQSPTPVTTGMGTQFPEIARTTVNMLTAQDITASPDGWIPDGGTTTTGNNVDACLDRVAPANTCDAGAIDNNGRPIGNPDANTLNRDFLGAAPRDYTYTPAPLAGNPDAGDDPTGATAVQDRFRRGVVTHLFYLTNWYHDQLFNLGFDEAAGNFQATNFSGMGTGNDRVLADAQDGSGTNNANFGTPPDGASGRMQMFIFTGPTPDRDGSLDAEIVLHELTHGTSNRLIGNAAGLTWDPGRGMGEGWSDFVALSLLNNKNTDNPDAKYASGAYATYQLNALTDNYLYGIRRFPYSTDNSINPLTWADVDDYTVNLSGGIPPSPINFTGAGAFEVHNTGELWAYTLWEVRSRVIADPAGANGDVPTGNQTMLQMVIDGMKMTPISPSVVAARNAIIDADCATNACANELSVWGGFADRGLGYKAVAPLGTIGPSRAGTRGRMPLGESFSVPYLDVASVAVNDTLGNNNGAIDPGEPIRLTVTLTNPWRKASQGVASATATLSSSTPGVTIVDGSAAYGPIAAQASAASVAGDTFLITVAPSALCGSSLDFSIQTVSTLGTTTATFKLRVGAAAGNGAPVTFTRTIPGGLAIPEANLLGVTDTFNVTSDLEIADLDFRVDSVTHTFSGDLGIEIKGPTGYGTEVIHHRGIFFGVANADGDNFTNTLIDDDLVSSPATDLNQSTPAQAPFTGSWLPAFNSPVWTLFGLANFVPDTVGQLSRFDGTSTLGNWQVHVTDRATPDTGTLNSWSLIVTPKAFTCSGVTPAVQLAATKTVSGTFVEGGTVTYTVTITNNGNATQTDNAGNELTDVLPASLTLVSASATSGTATANVGTNTVTWNGALTLGGGSVTITITATIDAGTNGTTISNQGNLSFDADVNGTNEATGVTDDPGTAAPNDPTSFGVAAGAQVTGTKTAAGAFTPGSTITYTVVLTNSGGNQADNPGNEFTDVLPASLTLVSASSTSGAAVATVGTNTVTWNGAIPSAGSVTITITATINAAITGGTTISNQGTFLFDGNADGTNESSGVTNNPATQAPGDPTVITVAGGVPAVTAIPTLSDFGFAALAFLLAMAAFFHLRRRRVS
jgi:uncharacterized repeat protein (TIGR01451 family)